MDIPTIDDLTDRATALVPYLKEHAAATEQRRTLSSDTVAKLHEAGFFRFFRPKAYGGYEMDWGSQYRFAKVLAHGCPSTAWVAAVVGQHSCHVARFAKQAQDEVWPDQADLLIATGSLPRANVKTERVAGGVRVSGSIGFASGVDHSGWAMASVPIDGAGHQILLPRADYEVEDTWFVAGMRGTGTKDIHVPGALVPDHRVMPSVVFNESQPPGAGVNPGYIYAMEFAPVQGSSPVGPLIGTAEGALATYIDMTRTKKGAIFGNKIAESSAVQMRLAESAAEINAADAVAVRDFQVLHEAGKTGRRLSDAERTAIVRNRAMIAKLCVRATQRLVQMMGALGLADDNPVQRHFRDVQAMVTQIGVAFDVNMPPWGRLALGLDPGPGLHGSEKRRV
ncbi:MAG: acyl-CoA dehydrogenase family protein [Proteobacteria bacterium]|nr:acyl-CoA dehydrogenase family protein [Pseudomonadota bacterium]